MSAGYLRRAIIAASLAVALVACDSLTVGPVASPLPALVTVAIERHGVVARPATPPREVVAPAAVMAEAVRAAGLRAAQPVYLELTCVPDTITPAPGVPTPDTCGIWDVSLAAGDTMGVWVVTFPGVSMGASQSPFALFDAKTGQFKFGEWP